MKLFESDILKARILIVYDQDANIVFLQQLFADAGYKSVTSTMNPQEVCVMHLQNPFDLILLDLQRPDPDAFRVRESLKVATSERNMPMFLLVVPAEHDCRALQSVAKDFIGRPFDLVELSVRIRNLLELHLLHKKLASVSQILEMTVQERTAELRESEECFRGLTELAADCYWEQDEHGSFRRTSGPILEMLGIRADSHAIGAGGLWANGWNEAEQRQLKSKIAARQPFLNFVFSRTNAKGLQQNFFVSGEPIFNQTSRFIGYRGIGVEFPPGTIAYRGKRRKDYDSTTHS